MEEQIKLIVDQWISYLIYFETIELSISALLSKGLSYQEMGVLMDDAIQCNRPITDKTVEKFSRIRQQSPMPY